MTSTEIKKAPNPFWFYTQLALRELTGLKAKNLKEFLAVIKAVPGSVIYHHTHHFLRQHQYLTPEPPNDFAYWIRESLGEDRLAERLASVDICAYSSIRSLREKFIQIIEEYIAKKGARFEEREAQEGEEFHFVKAVSFVIPTGIEAWNLEEFAEGLKKTTVDSLYYHIFEARLRLEKPTNDFSSWLENSLGLKELAKAIERLDPYTHTMDGLRKHILQLVDKEVKRSRQVHA